MDNDGRLRVGSHRRLEVASVGSDAVVVHVRVGDVIFFAADHVGLCPVRHQRQQLRRPACLANHHRTPVAPADGVALNGFLPHVGGLVVVWLPPKQVPNRMANAVVAAASVNLAANLQRHLADHAANLRHGIPHASQPQHRVRVYWRHAVIGSIEPFNQAIESESHQCHSISL